MASWDEIWARLSAFRQHLPEYYEIEERLVQDYHRMVSEFEAAGEMDLVSFRVVPEDIRPRVVSVSLATRFRPGRTNYSSENYCLRTTLLMKVDALISFLENRRMQQITAQESGPLVPSERLALAIFRQIELGGASEWRLVNVGTLGSAVGANWNLLIERLKDLWERGYLGLRKWSYEANGFISYSGQRRIDEDFFYRRDFQAKVEGRGRAYFERLEQRDERERSRQVAPAPQHAANIEARKLKAFLCHSSSDKGPVRNLYAQLEADGIEPWLDEENLLPGQDWDAEIRKAVRASGVVLVCLSRSSITKEGYVQKEIKLALDVADEKPEGTIYIIPVRLDGCELPRRIAHCQAVDLFADDGYTKLLAALRRRESQFRVG